MLMMMVLMAFAIRVIMMIMFHIGFVLQCKDTERPVQLGCKVLATRTTRNIMGMAGVVASR